MSQGPEARFWKSVRSSLPNKAFSTRIENKHGGGVPDVHVVWEGLPFWLELKVTKKHAVKVSPHQIAWHQGHISVWRGTRDRFTGEWCALRPWCEVHGP